MRTQTVKRKRRKRRRRKRKMTKKKRQKRPMKRGRKGVGRYPGPHHLEPWLILLPLPLTCPK